MKLNAKALGFTWGVIWGLTILLMTAIYLCSAKTYGKNLLMAIASVYPGYSTTPVGGLLGLCYGFVDGFACGWLTATLYNFFAKEK